MEQAKAEQNSKVRNSCCSEISAEAFGNYQLEWYGDVATSISSPVKSPRNNNRETRHKRINMNIPLDFASGYVRPQT